MKWFSVLLAVMVLTLSCMPCSDAIGLPFNTAKTATTAQDSHKNEQDHKDLCSPFCQCSCCSLAYALPLAAPLAPAEKPLWTSRIFAMPVLHFPSGIALPVWQPPQLV